MNIKGLLIGLLLFVLCFFSFSQFYVSLVGIYSEHGLTDDIDPDYASFYSDVYNSTMDSSSNSLNKLSSDMETSINQNEGTTGTIALIATGGWNAVKTIVRLPLIFNNLLVKVTSMFGIPSWFVAIIEAIILIVIVIAIISTLTSKAGDL